MTKGRNKGNKFKSDRNYEDWMLVKDSIQYRRVMRSFKEWEMWWCAVGENVGVEINGKGEKFIRPVIIFKKFGKLSFMGIPTTTQNHTNRTPDWYVHFKLKDVDEYAAINQIGVTSAFRLYRKMGELDAEDIKKILTGFWNLYGTKMPPQQGGVGRENPEEYLYYNKFFERLQEILQKIFCRKMK